MTFSKKAAWTFFFKAFSASLAFLTSILIAKIVGPSLKGHYAIFILIPLTLALLLNLGLNQANVFYASKKEISPGILHGNNALYVLFLLLAFSLPLWLFLKYGPVIPGYYGASPLLSHLVWIVPVIVLFELSIHLALGLEMISLFNGARIFRNVFFFSAIVSLLFMESPGIGHLINFWSLSWMAGLVYLLFRLYKKLGTRYQVNIQNLKTAIVFGIKAHPASVIGFLDSRVDQDFVYVMLGPQELGWYAIAVLFGEVIWIFSDALGTILFPHTAPMETEEANKITMKCMRVTFLVSGILSFCLGFLLYIVVEYFLPEYAPAKRALWILLPGIVLMSLDMILSQYIAGRGQLKWNSIFATLMIAVNLVLNYIWIPQYGINGAAAASLVSYVFGTFLAFVLFKRISGLSFLDIIQFKA